MTNGADNNPNKTDHDQPGGVRGTHIGTEKVGITNHPQEESERQFKVVHQGEKVEKIHGAR